MVRRIRQAAVIGSGIMGGGIAALLTGAGIKTLLLDIVPFDLKEEEKTDPKARNRIVTKGLEAAMKAGGGKLEKKGVVVLGTVEGDIHDIAKDIVGFMLDINGFEVTDLGVDVPPAKFVEAVKQTGAKIVGLSGFLTLAFDPMKSTVQALKEAGFNDVKIMIGGGQIDENIRQYTGADAYGKDAMAAVAIAKSWS